MNALTNKQLKSIVTALSIVLVICLTVAGTITYLQDSTDPVVNTFTTSDVSIKLEETTGGTYKMVPGDVIPKDPTVTVSADSEDCYVFVKIEKTENFDTYLTAVIADGWEKVSTQDNVYYRVVKNSDKDREFSVLADDQVTVNPTVTKEMMEALNAEGAKLPQLTFTAYAIQSANLTNQPNTTEGVDAADAWELVKGLQASANNS